MNIIAIKQDSKGKNIFFIADNYEEYSLAEIITLFKQQLISNLSLVKSLNKEIYIRAKKNQKTLESVAICCNEKDYLFFDGKYLQLKTINGKIKLKWHAVSGLLGSTKNDQNKPDIGPIPEGIYEAQFRNTLDIESHQNLWDELKWLIKSPSWGTIVTPLMPDKSTNTFGRSNFYIHGGWVAGSKGCIDLTTNNNVFHAILRLYKRNFKLIVKY